jgi:hypothetical protein
LVDPGGLLVALSLRQPFAGGDGRDDEGEEYADQAVSVDAGARVVARCPP